MLAMSYSLTFIESVIVSVLIISTAASVLLASMLSPVSIFTALTLPLVLALIVKSSIAFAASVYAEQASLYVAFA